MLEEIGNSLIIVDMTQNVFTLTENYRAMEDPVFGNILKNLRTCTLSDTGAERLMRQCLHLQNNESREKIENDPGTVWL